MMKVNSLYGSVFHFSNNSYLSPSKNGHQGEDGVGEPAEQEDRYEAHNLSDET